MKSSVIVHICSYSRTADAPKSKAKVPPKKVTANNPIGEILKYLKKHDSRLHKMFIDNDSVFENAPIGCMTYEYFQNCTKNLEVQYGSEFGKTLACDHYKHAGKFRKKADYCPYFSPMVPLHYDPTIAELPKDNVANTTDGASDVSNTSSEVLFPYKNPVTFNKRVARSTMSNNQKPPGYYKESSASGKMHSGDFRKETENDKVEDDEVEAEAEGGSESDEDGDDDDDTWTESSGSSEEMEVDDSGYVKDAAKKRKVTHNFVECTVTFRIYRSDFDGCKEAIQNAFYEFNVHDDDVRFSKAKHL